MIHESIVKNRLRVAIIEDNAGDAELLQSSLSSIPDSNMSFCRLANIQTPDEIVGELVQRHADFVFVNSHLANMTGLDVLNSMRGAGQILPLIMTGQAGNESTFSECLRAGADDYISKEQFDPASLRRAMQQAEARYLHRQAECELRFIQFSIDRSSDLVFWLDEAGRFTNVNEVACRQLGYTSDALFAVPFADIAISPKAKNWQQLWDQTHQQGAISFEDQLRRKDGSVFPVQLNVNYVEFDKKECRCVYARDITERKSVQRALGEKEEQLRQSQKLEAIGQLVGGLAHEFNNLLQVIAGLTELAMNEIPDDRPPYQDLAQVLSASRTAASLTRQLLGFSRQQPLNPTIVHPRQLVDDLLSLLRPLLGTSINLHAEIAEDTEPIQGDSALLQQVLMNLCLNGRDAMPSDGELVIHVVPFLNDSTFKTKHPDARADRYVLFRVSDTGSGIPRHIQKRVFDPFFTTKDIGKGTGLGLAVVYGIVKQHNGIIHFESQDNVGTTFFVYIPVQNSPSETADVTAEKLPVRGLETILVAEDEQGVREIATRILTNAGYHILSAADGADAVKVFSEHSSEIQLVMLDVAMPKLSGLDAYRRIQSMRPNVPVIFSTGHDVVALSHDPRTCAAHFLKKPFESRRLVSVVREALDTWIAG